MNLNEGQPDKGNKEIKTSDMKKEFEVLENVIKVQGRVIENQETTIANLVKSVKRIQQDLNLGRERYGGTNTRDMAISAFNQSTVKANWEGLSKHPVIENIYKALKTRASDEGRRADDIIRKFEYMPDFHEIMKQVGKHSEIGNLWSRVESIDSGIAELKDVQKVDRHNIYAKLATQRDKMADIETAINMIDFVMGDTFDSHNSAFIFLMGAFAELGKGRVEEGLRFMLKKPKEPKDHETTDETSQEG
jgi:hypothetical protein